MKMLSFTKRINWAMLGLVAIGMLSLIVGGAATDNIPDQSLLYGIAPFVLAQLALYLPGNKALKWLAMIAVGASLLAFVMVLYLVPIASASGGVYVVAILLIAEVPLAINMVALCRIPTNPGQPRNTPAAETPNKP
jgi:hypothetical protein